MLKKDIILKIKEMNKVINERFKVLQDYFKTSGEEDYSDFLKTQRNKFKLLSGTKSKNRIATGNLSRFNKTRLEDIERASEKFLKSEWSTISGRERIEAKRVETFRQRGYDFTKTQYKTFIKVINSPIMQELVEANYYDSEQIIDDLLSSDNLNSEDLLRTLDNLDDEINLNKLSQLSGSDISDLLEDMLTQRTIEINGENVLAYQHSDIYEKIKK